MFFVGKPPHHWEQIFQVLKPPKAVKKTASVKPEVTDKVPIEAVKVGGDFGGVKVEEVPAISGWRTPKKRQQQWAKLVFFLALVFWNIESLRIQTRTHS